LDDLVARAGRTTSCSSKYTNEIPDATDDLEGFGSCPMRAGREIDL
jgi:hypothetical protein